MSAVPLDCDPHGAAAGEDLRRTYFVDSESGQDSLDGQAPDRAWQSLDRVNAAELQPGDTVQFKCGGVWRGCLVPASGEEGASHLHIVRRRPKATGPRFGRAESSGRLGEGGRGPLGDIADGVPVGRTTARPAGRHVESSSGGRRERRNDSRRRSGGAPCALGQQWQRVSVEPRAALGTGIRIDKGACLMFTFRHGALSPFVSRVSASSSAAHPTHGMPRRGLSPPL